MTRLAWLNAIVMALLVLHILDHGLNQPARDLPVTGTVIGVSGLVLIAISAVLAIGRSPRAPAAALIVGTITALGIVAVHLLPGWWTAVSDPYWDFDANALSWIAALAPLAAALLLAAEGLREMRRPIAPRLRT